MKYLVSSLFLVTILFSSGYSQAEIKGQVVGDGDEPLLSATIVVLSKSDSTLVSFALTNDDGEFSIKDVTPESYLLQVTFLGYEQLSQDLTVPDSNPIDLGVINLSQNKNQLQQVEIKGEHVPLVVKKDTLEYNAAAFQTQPNEVVEDLLKKLPGVEVESDGSIKAQGEDVKSVLVDGKRFFGDDPKIATKNLPADAVEKVQIYDRMSDMAEFSGVDDGERIKTIDLKLKEDRKKGQFGTAELGYGTEERYKGRLSLNRFTNKMQLSAIGNFNNINEQGFSSGDYMNFVRGIGGNWGRLNDSGLSMFNGLSDGFVTTHAGGINLNYDFSEKIDMSVSYFLNTISNDIESLVQREEFIRQGSFFDVSNVEQSTTSDNHKVNSEFNIEIDSSQNIRVRGGFTLNDGSISNFSTNGRDDTSQKTINTSAQELNTSGKSLGYNGSLMYRKKLGKIKKRILTLSLGLNTADDDSDGTLESDNLYFPGDPNLELAEQIFQDQLQNDEQFNYNLRASFVEPLKNGNFLEFKYRRQNYSNDLLYDVYDVLNGVQTYNDILSNSYDRNFNSDRYGLAWHLNTDKSSLTVEGMLQSSQLRGVILTNDSEVKYNLTRVLPRLSWRHDLASGSNIRLRYSTSINEPSLEQLQPTVDNSDPLNIYLGNPELRPEYRHNLRLNFMKYDQFSFSSFFAFINARFSKNKIENQTSISQRYVRTTQPVNVKNDLSLSGNMNYSSPVSLLKTRMTLGTRISYAKGITFLNGQSTDRTRYIGNINAKIENRNKSKFDIVVGGSWGFNVTSFDTELARNQEFFSQSLFTDLKFNIKNSWAISTNLDVNFFSEEQIGEAQTVPILKASLSKYILKDQKGEIKLTAFDLLNQNLGISRRNGSNYVENSEITSLGRFYMLSFIYAIRGGNMAQSKGGSRGPRSR